VGEERRPRLPLGAACAHQLVAVGYHGNTKANRTGNRPKGVNGQLGNEIRPDSNREQTVRILRMGGSWAKRRRVDEWTAEKL